ncbi:MAG TPA: HAD-IC family P-type ATPase [Gaiellaceae bacterium]|nr:HAD-IC family P-type ATPase [Gaiellaceae bacterium]
MDTTGLTQAEAAKRLKKRGPHEPQPSSRSYGSIVRANVFTVFNLVLLVFGVITLAFGAWQDALFLIILVANAGIGIFQEIRAKNALDHLAALVTPTARVVRDGEVRELPVDDVLVDDLVRLRAGDQVVGDGRLAQATGLRVDESILTGEAEPVARGAGEEVRSGSFAVEGDGAYVVTAVGAESYAERVAGEAREFRHPRSPLERSFDRLLFILVAILVPLAAILGYALWERDTPKSQAVSTAVAAGVTLIPEGLILLTSVTFAVAALAIARRGALAQQLNAVESLASVDVMCMDKTGTLTEPNLRVVEAVPANGDGAGLERDLGRFAASFPTRNATLDAVAEAYEAPPEQPSETVPFSSRYRWSGARLGGTTWVLGAPERFPLGSLADRAAEEAGRGRRVLALASTQEPLDGRDPAEGPPAGLTTHGLVLLAERLRDDAAETVRFFLDQGVELKVLSGDRPATVAAIAADAGVPVTEALDGEQLPMETAALRETALAASVVGRISPEGKRRVVEALRDSGRYVAMVGDGVNDVPALKAARLAIAQGSGAQMARSVADVVLVRGTFAAVPPMVGEGRRVFRNLQRVAKLFVTKSVFAVVLILSIGLTPIAYPLLPRHLTIAAAVTIGIPAFFLALAPSGGGFQTEGFLRDVARFSVPAGTAAGLGVLASYLFALNVANMSLTSSQTVATTVLVIVGLYLILALEASGLRRGAAVSVMVAALGALYFFVLAFPPTRHFFSLSAPGFGVIVLSVIGAALAIVFLVLTDDRFIPPLAFEVEDSGGRNVGVS